MSSKPMHTPTGGRPAAERSFVDREEFVAPVETALREPPRTKPLVLVYHGGAGIGKSRLRRELTQQMAGDPKVVTATLDFDIPSYRQPETALLFLRNSIREAYKVRFLSFDLAYAIYWQKTHPDTAPGSEEEGERREAGPESEFDHKDTKAQVQTDESGMQPLLEPGSLLPQLLDESGKLPLIGLVPKISALVGKSPEPPDPRTPEPLLGSWWSKRGERELGDLPQMGPGAIVERLPRFWASDLKAGLGEKSLKAVLFIDAYEHLWETGSSEADFFRRDEWVRELVKQLPEVLWIICGRQKLRWEEVEADWGKALSQHQLGALPDKSARRFLESCDITNGQIQDAIVKGSQGVPHYLDLAVDTIQSSRYQVPGTRFQGENPEELVEQFTQHLDQPEVETLRVLSAARFWYYGLFEHLTTEYQTGYPLTGYDDLSRFSFVKEGAAPGTRTMHELMREALQESQSPELRKRVHLFLHELYAKQLEGLGVKNITEQHRLALNEAFYHGRQAKSAVELWAWFEAAARVFNEARQDRLLAPLYREMAQALEAELGPEHPDVTRSLNRLARVLYNQQRYAEAEPLFRRSLAAREKVLGPEHPEVAQTQTDLASLLRTQDNYAEAEPLYRRALAIREKAFGPEHPNTGDSLNGLVQLLISQGKDAEAEPLSRRALAIYEKTLGPDHPAVGDSLWNLAGTLYGLGKYAEAEPLCRRALTIREKALGPVHPSTANTLEKLALLLNAQGKYADADPLYRRALLIYEETLGPNHSETARALDHLAVLLINEGKYAEAETLRRRALAITEKVLGPEHSDTARVMGNLSLLLRDQGRFAEAEPLSRRALAILEKVLGPEHLTVAYALHGLSTVVGQQSRYAEAEPLARRALAIWEKGVGPDHDDVAMGLDTLAIILEEQHRYAEAEPLYRRALAIREKALGPEHSDVAATLNNLSVVLGDLHRYEEAEPLVKRALAIWEKGLGPEHPRVAIGLDTLSVLLRDQHRYAEAEPLARRALAIWEKRLGPEHPKVAVYLDTLCVLLLEQSKLAEGEVLARRALAIREAKLGPNHHSLAKTLDILTKVCEQTGRSTEAQELFARAQAIRDENAKA